MRRRLHAFFYPRVAETLYWLLVVAAILALSLSLSWLYRRATHAEAARDLACVEAYYLIYGRVADRLTAPSAGEACAALAADRESRRYVRLGR